MSIDLVEKSFNSKFVEYWETSSDLENIFTNVYISEKYKKELHFLPFVNIIIGYSRGFFPPPSLHDHNVKFDKDARVIDNISTEYSLNDYKTVKKYKDLYKNTEKRFVYYPVTLINYGFDFVYNTFFLYDRKYNEVNFFDTMNVDMGVQKKYFRKFFSDIHGKDVKMIYNTKLLDELSKIDYYNCHNSYEYDGNNQSILLIFWFLEVILKNNDKSLNNQRILEEVYNKLSLEPEKLCKILNSYAKYVNKITDDYNLTKVNKNYILRVSKKKIHSPKYKKRLLAILAGLIVAGVSYKLIYKNVKKDYKK